MNAKVELNEMDMNQVSGGMTTHEWNVYNKKYDIAIYKASKAGDKKLLEKLYRERPFKEYGQLEKAPEGVTPPYLKLKLEDLPKV
ncbi:MAG: hypothetical protein IJ712_05330 [Anaerovibrio sp.]|uniref:hypothetical protein n=1 Tax=Anaerovibrio TaxID=82373 RepID=UPI0025B9140D|nr:MULTISPECIES: hypothetical protein [Anaerovibrio]MBE6106863.1 hypothetical protein [Anaerovibrio lipolyticus]MBR1697630.1 hypothetical protein [Anaerovibrio sp.]MBR2142323.1 hypothetical protein [Anaerovibrio sp.]